MSESDAERVRAERGLLDQLADLVLELASDGRVLYANEAIERLLGLAPAMVRGLSFLEVLTSETRDPTITALRKVVETGETTSITFDALRSDGARIALEAALRARTGGPLGPTITAVCRDVTHQVAEQATRQKRLDQYRALVEAGGLATAIARPDGTLEFANRAFRQLFGAAERVDSLVSDLGGGQRRALENAWFAPAREAPGESRAIELEVRDENGRPIDVALRWQPFDDAAGDRLFVLEARDVTRAKQLKGAFAALARGIRVDDGAGLLELVAGLASGLELARLVLARLERERPNEAQILAGWQDGSPLPTGAFELAGLPEEVVARGELCVHPTGVSRLLPSVVDRFGCAFESFAGVGLALGDEPNGEVVGLLAGYSRRSAVDPEAWRGVLISAAAPLGRMLGRSNTAPRTPASSEAISRDDRVPSAPHAIAPDPNDLASRPVSPWSDRSQPPWSWSDSPSHPTRSGPDLARELLRRFVHKNRDLVFVCEPDTNVLYSNERASRQLRVSEGLRPTRRMLFDLFVPEDAERLRSEILPRLSPSFPWSGELSLRDGPDDGPIPTLATCLLFEDPLETEANENPRPRLAVMLRDIRAQRRVEEALRQSELRLAEARKLEAVGRLAGGIAHDFNNLLTAIIGYGDLALQTIDETTSARADVEEMLRAAERASGLTRQLLAFSRRQALTPEPVDLNAVVADIDRMLRRLIGENIELVTQLDGELASVLADPGQMEQVIVNLVVNARDAQPRGGRVEIETANHACSAPQTVESGTLAAGEWVVLRVRDAGIGMDEATLAQIFEPFFTTKTTSGGTGLGLASVYGIVARCGGQIDVESRLGHGTTFTIYLPAAPVQADEGRDATTRPEVAGGQETVLVVEDSGPVRRLVERTLRGHGYQVLPAESATAALRHCSRHEGSIDLILCDVVLPRMAGPELVRRAQELRPGIRTLFMSGCTEETLAQHGLASDEPDLIEKPFSSVALLTRVRRQLDDGPPILPTPLH